MPITSKPVRVAFESLSAVLLLALPVLCLWQIVHGLKGGDIVCPLYYHGSIIFTEQDSPDRLLSGCWLSHGNDSSKGVMEARTTLTLNKITGANAGGPRQPPM
jgi:hypothetical protein